jgi:hypothetical protein
LSEDTVSFFHGIQSLFSAKYHGRYLATILVEVGRQRPASMVDFLAHSAGIAKRKFSSPRFEVEYSFKGAAGNRRRADIAVFANHDDDEPILLVEIKYFDKPIEAQGLKPAQLEDYAAWVNAQQGRHFVAICREQLSISYGAAVRWGDLANRLKLHVNNSDLVRLLIDYLEKEGITVQEIESKPLINFFKSLLCSPWGSGVLANNLNGPVEFGKLQMNLKYMAGAFDPVFKKAWREAGEKVDGDDYAKTSRTATIGFHLTQCLKTTDNSKLFNGEDTYLLNSQKDGGTIAVYAQYSLGHGQSDWLRVAFGFFFQVESDSNTTNEPTAIAFAEITGSKVRASAEKRQYREKKVKFSDVTADAQKSHNKIEIVFSQLLVDVVSLLSEQGLPLLKQQKIAVSRLLKALPNTK